MRYGQPSVCISISCIGVRARQLAALEVGGGGALEVTGGALEGGGGGALEDDAAASDAKLGARCPVHLDGGALAAGRSADAAGPLMQLASTALRTAQCSRSHSGAWVVGPVHCLGRRTGALRGRRRLAESGLASAATSGADSQSSQRRPTELVLVLAATSSANSLTEVAAPIGVTLGLLMNISKFGCPVRMC